jgi:lipopolysaccharide/colanic/teichoic acid biosynthesis glycosyltransferase
LSRSPRVVDRIPLSLRALDLTLLLLALPVVLPLALVVALAVFLDSPGPVLYRSRRVGRGARVFEMLKFRTMLRDAAGPPLSVAGDERYTPLGRRLAATRLDELPQLWNVARGQMRLVGPRPEVEDFVRDFAEQYETILSVPPGLTGPAQLEYAWEGEVLAHAQEVDRARVYRESILPLKLAIDSEYARRHGVLRDLRILIRTTALPLRRVEQRLRPEAAASGTGRPIVALIAALIGALTCVYVLEAGAPL